MNLWRKKANPEHIIPVGDPCAVEPLGTRRSACTTLCRLRVAARAVQNEEQVAALQSALFDIEPSKRTTPAAVRSVLLLARTTMAHERLGAPCDTCPRKDEFPPAPQDPVLFQTKEPA